MATHQIEWTNTTNKHHPVVCLSCVSAFQGQGLYSINFRQTMEMVGIKVDDLTERKLMKCSFINSRIHVI